MIYTVNYIRENGMLAFNKGDTMVKHYNEDGEEVDETKYLKQSFAQTKSSVIPPFIKGRYDIALPYKTKEDKERFNQYVKDCFLVYPKDHKNAGELIEKANPLNIRDPFFTNQEFRIEFESGQAVLDDELPLDFMKLKWLENDARFMFPGEEVNPLISGKVSYSVSSANKDEEKEDNSVDEVMEAIKILDSADFEKRKKIARAMGVYVRKPEPKHLRNLLFRKITEEKDNYSKDFVDKRNIDVFFMLGNAPTVELNIRETITQAVNQNVLMKKAGGVYYYDDTKVGNTIESTISYLKENEDVLSEVIDKTNFD